MANILIAVYALTGAVNATRKVARDLRRRGHSVYYIGHPGCASVMEGEAFFPLFPVLAPPPQAERLPARMPSFVAGIRNGRQMAQRNRSMIEGLHRGEYGGFEQIVRDIRPDLMLIVSTTSYAALWGLLAHRFEIPAVLLNDSLTGPEDGYMPPVAAHRSNAGRIAGCFRTCAQWAIAACKSRLRNLYPQIVFGLNWERMLRDYAAAIGFPPELLVRHEHFFFRTRCPELVMVPEVFDFPRLPRFERQYTAASVDMERAEVDFPWDRLDPGRKVIYCATGTTPCLDREACRSLYRAVLEAFVRLPDRYELVITARRDLRAEFPETQGSHVTIVERAPQIALLRRAAAMITHGGANTVKECATLGVPMLLYPVGFDTNGFAARAVAHGIGLKLDTLTGVEISRKLAELLTISFFRLQAARMRLEFERAEETNSCADAVERLLPRNAVRAAEPEPAHAAAAQDWTRC